MDCYAYAASAKLQSQTARHARVTLATSMKHQPPSRYGEPCGIDMDIALCTHSRSIARQDMDSTAGDRIRSWSRTQAKSGVNGKKRPPPPLLASHRAQLFKIPGQISIRNHEKFCAQNRAQFLDEPSGHSVSWLSCLHNCMWPFGFVVVLSSWLHMTIIT